MKCPVDHEPLELLQVDVKFLADIHLDACRKCSGIWVGADELQKLVTGFSSDYQQTYRTWLSATTDGVTKPKDFWREGERACPKDGSLLLQHYTGAAHGVGINQCPTCKGFWFDGSELYAIAKANEPTQQLDSAIGGFSSVFQEEFEDRYKSETVFWWDMASNPLTAIPYIKDALLNLMVMMIARK